MAALTSKQRKNMPKSEFIFPKRKAYPIPDEDHGSRAIAAANGARTGKPLPPAQRAKVKREVYAKFPSLKKGTSGLSKTGKGK